MGDSSWVMSVTPLRPGRPRSQCEGRARRRRARRSSCSRRCRGCRICGSAASAASRRGLAGSTSSRRLVAAKRVLGGARPGGSSRRRPSGRSRPGRRAVRRASPGRATAAVAKSPTFRSSFRYVPPVRGPGSGTRTSVITSSGSSVVVNGPSDELVDARSSARRLRPRATTSPRAASIAEPQSPCGSACASEPQTVPRFRTSGSATSRAVVAEQAVAAA